VKGRRNRKAETANRRTVAYVRVSTDDQAENGVSLASQEARIAAYATAMGFDVAEVVCDAGASARSLQRHGMGRVLDAIASGDIGRVVILKLDRITRSTRDLAELLDLFAKHGAALVSVSEHLDTQSASGRLAVNMLGVVAQWEREAIGERTASALAHKRHQRVAYGPTPFGYRREGRDLLPDVAEQAALREAQRMDEAGASFREIGGMLTERGLMPHRGKAWYASSVRAMLRSRIASEAAAITLAARHVESPAAHWVQPLARLTAVAPDSATVPKLPGMLFCGYGRPRNRK